MDRALSFIEEHHQRHIGELEDFLRIPSVSTDPEFATDVNRGADWLAERLRTAGIDKAEVIKTDIHPIILAEHVTDPKKPTVVAYGHYDVQPPDPLDLWTSDPFEPTVRDGQIFARGAVDDKGQLMMIVNATEAYLKSSKELPVNLKMVFEGEEECASESMGPFLEKYKDRLTGDVALICDTSMAEPGIPAITASLRGIVYMEFFLKSSNRDLHSGLYGGAIHNPLNVLGRVIASLHDDDGRIAVAGMYDDVRDLSAAEREEMKRIPFDEAAWLETVGVRGTWTEPGYTTLEAATIRPTVDMNGVWGGYAGEGSKTIIAAEAGAKISARLVPDQTPDDIMKKLQRHIREHTPESIEVTFNPLGVGSAINVDPNHPGLKSAARALEEVFKVPPVMLRGGGSIPAAAMMRDVLGLEPLLVGFGLDTDRVHAPDEHFGLDRFRMGIESIARFFSYYGENGGA
ncbi:MAG: dipeptidase [bacterium]|nr:dipeptidase [bacterium]